MDALNRDLGRVEGKVEKIEDDIEELRAELARTNKMVAEIHQAMTHVKGGWKMLVVVATVSSTLTATAFKVLAWVRGAGLS